MKSKTKIIATIGPSSSSKDILREMVNSIDLARLNFSFGDYNFHEQNINNIRELSSELNKNIAILQDIQGPKIRVTKILNQEIDLKYEHTLIILPEQNIFFSSIFVTSNSIDPSAIRILSFGLTS
jgi:pyruvate kinase